MQIQELKELSLMEIQFGLCEFSKWFLWHIPIVCTAFVRDKPKCAELVVGPAPRPVVVAIGWQRCYKQWRCVGLSLGSPCHRCRVACGVCVCACVARFGKGKVYKPRTAVVPINVPVVQARLQDLLVAMRHASR